MKRDAFKTEMIFRKDKEGIFCLMPYEISNLDGSVTCYQHIGQHGQADYKGCIEKSVPAKPKEYADLLRELKSRGYYPKIVKRQNYSRYLRVLHETREKHK